MRTRVLKRSVHYVLTLMLDEYYLGNYSTCCNKSEGLLSLQKLMRVLTGRQKNFHSFQNVHTLPPHNCRRPVIVIIKIYRTVTLLKSCFKLKPDEMFV